MNALKKIISRHLNFRYNISRDQQILYKKLASGQQPKTLFITCSDSRVDPGFATQSEPGDLFVIRNAGNIVSADQRGSSELATIEYAVEILGVENIIVCGHSDCGAVKALMNPDSIIKFPAITEYLCSYDSYMELDNKESVIDNVKIHTLNQLVKLQNIDFVQNKVNQGSLKLLAWIFDIESYSFHTYNNNNQWVQISNEAEKEVSFSI